MIALITILCGLIGGMIGWGMAERAGDLPCVIFIPIGLVCGAIVGCIAGVILSHRYDSGADHTTILGSLIGAVGGYFIAHWIAVLRGGDRGEAAYAAWWSGVPIGLTCGAIIGFIVGVRLSHR
jgi:hypothetical protein